MELDMSTWIWKSESFCKVKSCFLQQIDRWDFVCKDVWVLFLFNQQTTNTRYAEAGQVIAGHLSVVDAGFVCFGENFGFKNDDRNFAVWSVLLDSSWSNDWRCDDSVYSRRQFHRIWSCLVVARSGQQVSEIQIVGLVSVFNWFGKTVSDWFQPENGASCVHQRSAWPCEEPGNWERSLHRAAANCRRRTIGQVQTAPHDLCWWDVLLFVFFPFPKIFFAGFK